MLVTAWIIFIIFSFSLFASATTIFYGNGNFRVWIMFYIEAIVVAIASGILWGGLVL